MPRTRHWIGPALAAAMLAAPLSAALAETVIRFATDGGPSGRHAYYFVAEEKGYFAKEGLKVEIIGGKGSAAVIKDVGAGSIDIGFADAGTLALARGNEGVPAKLVAVVYRHAPHALVALQRPELANAKDLLGKHLADTPGSSNVTMFPAYAKAIGIDPKGVEWIYADFNTLPGLLATGQADAIGQYTLGLPLLRKRAAPKELTVFAYRDAGLDFYSNGIVVRDDYLAKNRDIVVKFVRASLLALKDALADPDMAAAAMHKHYPLIETDIIAGETREVKTVAADATTDKKGLGHIEPAAMQKTIDLMAQFYDLKKPVRVEEIVDEKVVPEALSGAKP